MPTALQVAGISLGDSYKIDGQSLLPVVVTNYNTLNGESGQKSVMTQHSVFLHLDALTTKKQGPCGCWKLIDQDQRDAL